MIFRRTAAILTIAIIAIVILAVAFLFFYEDTLFTDEGDIGKMSHTIKFYYNDSTTATVNDPLLGVLYNDKRFTNRCG